MAAPPSHKDALGEPHGDTTLANRGASTSGAGNQPLRLALIFCLLAFVSIGVNVAFIWDTKSLIQQKSGPPSIEASATGGVSEMDRQSLLATHRNRLLVLLGVTACSFAVIIYLYMKMVVAPLDIVARAAKEISKGNLKVTAPTNPAGQIGEFAGAINDLAANFQEVLLLTGTAVGNSREALDRIEKNLGQQGRVVDEELRRQIDLIRDDLTMLASVVKEFDFYQVRFDGRKVMQDGRRSKH